ncbi:nucleoside deaminase [Candidatus Shikimatogenerans silvanidophilus]|uniref:nucleoside deaminase n=1 Tax=Candidatus Shikimatogenerans silvanidophilus TaxID=2782547 RepID=UPI001BA80333|nr:nucleoside deaminase [Candidatus Shikimatogenerans silvanidophilus]
MDEYYKKWMNIALKEAKYAFKKNEIPIGSIILYKKKILSKAHNLTQTLNDCTAHAEIKAINKASIYLNDKYLNNCIVFVTLEPCIMCFGAIVLSKIKKIVFGSKSKNGFSNFGLEKKFSINFVSGVLEKKCTSLINLFFKNKRINNKIINK